MNSKLRSDSLSQKSDNRPFIRLRIVFGSGLVLIVLGLVLQPEFRDQFSRSLYSLSLFDVALITFLFALMRFVQAAILQRTLWLHRVKIGFISSLNLVGLKGLFNLAFFGLGLAAQSARAKLALLVPVKVTVFATLTQSFMLIFALGLTLTIAALALHSGVDFPLPAIFVFLGVFFGVAGLVGSVACMYPEVLPEQVRLFKLSRRWRLTGPGRKPGMNGAFILVILNIALVVLRVARVLVIAYAIDPAVNLNSLTITVLAADTLGVVPVTPGGIGLRELIIGLIGAAAKQYETFLAAAVIDRVVIITFNLIHGSVAVWTSGSSNKASE